MTTVLTSISQVMQVFPEPALEDFEITEEKIQGYILHESDILVGIVNYAYSSAVHNYIEMSLQSFGIDSTGYIDFVWNPDGAVSGEPVVPLAEGPDFQFVWETRTLTLTAIGEAKIVAAWNAVFTAPTTTIGTVMEKVRPVEFTVLGGTLDGQRKRGYFYDSGRFYDSAQQLFLNMSAVDPFIQRLCALLVVLDIIKYWIKPLYQVDEASNIAGTQFSDKDALPGWDHMQKRLENAIKEMFDAIKRWGIKNGRVGNGAGSNPENPDLLRSLYIATAVRGSSTTSPTEFSPFMGWDDPFLFERPDRTSALGDTLFGYTGRGWSTW